MKNSPLVEAWLELRWELDLDPALNIPTDSHFPFALGIFYNSIKDEFSYQEVLPSSQVPGFIPYLIQHRFRTAKDGWPLLQLGPGIATLNFSKPYSWTAFKDRALYFREKLLYSYQSTKLKANGINLRYRNVYPYKYTQHSLSDFLQKLNINLTLPANIPGNASEVKFPTQQNLLFQYNLMEPKAMAQIQIASGMNKSEGGADEEVILWELLISSINQNAPDLYNIDAFTKWLDDAHGILHDWFFSLVDGTLFTEFSGKG